MAPNSEENRATKQAAAKAAKEARKLEKQREQKAKEEKELQKQQKRKDVCLFIEANKHEGEVPEDIWALISRKYDIPRKSASSFYSTASKCVKIYENSAEYKGEKLKDMPLSVFADRRKSNSGRKRKWEPQEVAKMVHVLPPAKKRTVTSIAKETGISRQTISRFVKQKVIKLSPPLPTPLPPMSELSRDVLKHVLSFLPPQGEYAFTGSVNREFQELFLELCNQVKEEDRPLGVARKCKWGDDRWTWGYQTYYTAAVASIERAKQWHKSEYDTFKDHICEEAAYAGKLDVLIWANNSGFFWDKKSMDYAALAGHLHVVKHLHEKKCLFDEETCARAARGGHLHVLEYLVDQEDCDWDCTTLRSAALRGHVKVLEWAHRKNCPFLGGDTRIDPDDYENYDDFVREQERTNKHYILMNAIRSGSIPTVEYALDNIGCVFDDNSVECANCYSQYEVLDYVLRRNCKMNALRDDTYPSVVWMVASRGSVAAMQYALANGCELNKTAVKNAIQGFRVEMLEFLLQNRCPMAREDLVELVARAVLRTEDGSGLRILQLLFQYGALKKKSYPRLVTELARGGRVAAIRCAFENGCDRDNKDALEAAVQESHIDMIEYLLREDNIYLSSRNMVDLVSGVISRIVNDDGDLRVLKLLFKHDVTGYAGACNLALPRLDVLKFLVENGCSWEKRAVERKIKAAGFPKYNAQWTYLQKMEKKAIVRKYANRTFFRIPVRETVN